MKRMKKAFSLFLALAMTAGLAVTASAESPDASEYIHFDQDPIGVYKLPEQDSTLNPSGEPWTLYVYPDGTEVTFDLPDGYNVFGLGYRNYEDEESRFTVGGDMIDTTFMEITGFVLEADDAVWELNVHSDTVSTNKIHIASASQAAQLPLQPVSGEPGEPGEQPSAWAQGYVKEAVEAGIVPTELQSNYTQAATRGEFCALAVQLYETTTGKIVTERVKFNDTTDENVEKAAALGVISGVGGGKAAPDGTLTREQAATMLARLAEVCGKPLSSGNVSFADSSSISGWAAASVNQVGSSGIMNGTGDGNFSPQSQYTREQSITTMLSLFHYVNK